MRRKVGNQEEVFRSTPLSPLRVLEVDSRLTTDRLCVDLTAR